MEKLRLQACGTGPKLATGSGGTKHVVFGPDGFDQGICAMIPPLHTLSRAVLVVFCMRLGFFFSLNLATFGLRVERRDGKRHSVRDMIDASSAGLQGAYTWRLEIIHGRLCLWNGCIGYSTSYRRIAWCYLCRNFDN